MATSEVRPSGQATPGGIVVQGNIAARIDRLPLTRIQYTLAGITQIFWGLIINTDGIVARLYPFVWEPLGITTFQYSLLYAANTGLGIVVGQYFGGPLSDRYGRRTILIWAAIVSAVFLWPMAHTNVFGWLLLWNLLQGLGLGMVLATNNVYLHEIAPTEARHKLAMRAQLITGVCGFVPGILGILFVPDSYEWFIYILTFMTVLLIPLGLYMLPESPRWLEQKGRVEKADAIVSEWERKIEARHGALAAPTVERNPVVQTQKVPLGELFGPQYRGRVILLIVVWSLGYGGLIYGTAGFIPVYLADNGWSSDDVFLWYGLIAPALVIVAFYACSYLTRFEPKNLVVTVTIIWSALMAVLLLTSAFIGQALVILLATPMATLWLFNMYNYTSISFPTRIRSAGYSWTNGIGHTAQVWAPIVVAPIFAATAAAGHWGWILWVTVPGALVPALLIGIWGTKQKGRTLEEAAT